MTSPPLSLLLLFFLSAIFAPSVEIPGMSSFYKFNFIEENGIEKPTCSAFIKVVHTVYSLVHGTYNQTTIFPTHKCCDGYELRNGACFQKDPDNLCRNMSCHVEGSECVAVKNECGHKIAVFMNFMNTEEGEIVEECHPPGYLDILDCSKYGAGCSNDTCSKSKCPKLKSMDVLCVIADMCSCEEKWLRRHDWKEMDCLTGQVKNPCNDYEI